MSIIFFKQSSLHELHEELQKAPSVAGILFFSMIWISQFTRRFTFLLAWIHPVNSLVLWHAGVIMCMRRANEQRRYIVASILVGWAHTQNDPWIWQRIVWMPFDQRTVADLMSCRGWGNSQLSVPKINLQLSIWRTDDIELYLTKFRGNRITTADE